MSELPSSIVASHVRILRHSRSAVFADLCISDVVYRFLTITTSSHRLKYRDGKNGDHYNEKLAPPRLYGRMGLCPPLGDGRRQGNAGRVACQPAQTIRTPTY